MNSHLFQLSVSWLEDCGLRHEFSPIITVNRVLTGNLAYRCCLSSNVGCFVKLRLFVFQVAKMSKSTDTRTAFGASSFDHSYSSPGRTSTAHIRTPTSTATSTVSMRQLFRKNAVSTVTSAAALDALDAFNDCDADRSYLVDDIAKGDENGRLSFYCKRKENNLLLVPTGNLPGLGQKQGFKHGSLAPVSQ